MHYTYARITGGHPAWLSCRSADFVMRYWNTHAVIGRLLAIRCKNVLSLKKAVKRINISCKRHCLCILSPCLHILNGLDFLLLKGQSHDNVCSLQNFVAVRCTTQKFIATFCKSKKPVLHWEPPCLKNHTFKRGL
jgi:hypothetical protein